MAHSITQSISQIRYEPSGKTARGWFLPLCLIALLTGCMSLREPGPGRDLGAVPSPDITVPSFHEVTGPRGLPDTGARFVYWLDFDNDLYPDLLVDGTRLFRNTGPPAFAFVDVTAMTGLTGSQTCALACVDFDNDGWTDVVTTRGELWRNREGKQFVNIAKQAGFQPHAKAGVIGAGDVDGNGYADLYVGMKEDWNAGNPTYYARQLWLNRDGRHFSEVGRASGINLSTYARSVLFSDVNGDGRQDIFVANYRLQPNLLWLNRGACRFRNVARKYGVAGRYAPEQYLDPVSLRRYGPRWGHTIGACWWDFDNDGRQDLFTANLVHKYVGPSNIKRMRYDIRGYVCDDSAIYRHQGKYFVNWRKRLGVPLMPMGGPAVYQGDELWAGCCPGDANNDGWTDVFVPQVYNLDYAKAKLLLNAGGVRLADAADKAGIRRIDTYAGAWADFDSDGLLDLITAGRPRKDKPARLCLYRNRGSQEIAARNWLKVRLQQSGTRTMLGTRLTVRAGELTQFREFSVGHSSYGQQNGPNLHFGLGDWQGGVSIVVRWPDGAMSEVDARPNTLVIIAEIRFSNDPLPVR